MASGFYVPARERPTDDDFFSIKNNGSYNLMPGAYSCPKSEPGSLTNHIDEQYGLNWDKDLLLCLYSDGNDDSLSLSKHEL